MYFRLKSQSGFTLIELVMYILLSSLIFGTTAYVMMAQLDSYQTITNRQTALADGRYAMDRIYYELLRIDSADLTAIADHQIDFTDRNGNATNFRLAGTSLYRGNDLLAENIQALDFTYFNQAGNETNLPSEVRRIQVGLETSPSGDEGSLNLSHIITPRNFIYESYQ